MYPFDFSKSKNYWQVLGLPSIDKNNRISNDMSMRQIKSQFVWKLDYNKERLEKLNNCLASAKIEPNINFRNAITDNDKIPYDVTISPKTVNGVTYAVVSTKGAGLANGTITGISASQY